MRIASLLSGTALVTVLAALNPDAATANPVIPSINIDESVEGALPTVSGNGISLTNVSVSQLAVAEGEAWTISFDLPGSSSIFVGGEGGALTEPGTGKLSDVLLASGRTVNTDSVTFSFHLFSDDELGNIGSGCPVGCVPVLETGDFQFMNLSLLDISTQPFTTDAQIFLKSDLDEVPEPASLALLSGGLGAFWMLRRRRKRA